MKKKLTIAIILGLVVVAATFGGYTMAASVFSAKLGDITVMEPVPITGSVNRIAEPTTKGFRPGDTVATGTATAKNITTLDYVIWPALYYGSTGPAAKTPSFDIIVDVSGGSSPGTYFNREIPIKKGETLTLTIVVKANGYSEAGTAKDSLFNIDRFIPVPAPTAPTDKG